MSSDIAAKLHASRKELLDIGLRNNLISFRKTARSLALLPCDAGEVFDALYAEEKALSILATGRPGKASGDSSDDLGATDLELLQELAHGQALQESTESGEEASKERKPAKARAEVSCETCGHRATVAQRLWRCEGALRRERPDRHAV